MLIFKFPFGPLVTNAILLACEKTRQAAVVDPSPGSCYAILREAEENNLTIQKILLTHSHWDHFADAHQLQKKTGAPIYAHPLDVKNLEKPGSDRLPLFIPIEPVKVDHLLKEKEIIEIGQLNAEVIHTPGHCPGSVCFYIADENLLISGDTLFKGSIGNLSLPTAEPEKMWTSLEKLARLPSQTRVIPGHGDETTIGKESWLTRAKQIFGG